MKTTRLMVYVEPEISDWLKLKAIERAYETKDLKLRNVSVIVYEAIKDYIEKDNKMKLRSDKEAKRQKEALERQELHEKLTAEQKLAKLDSKLGVNVGARKERARLKKELKPVKSNKKHNKLNEVSGD